MIEQHRPDSDTSDREIALTRLFDAPREIVFAAWKDPVTISNWWGPRGFTTTTYEMKFRPGGVWRFVMHGPDGVDYKNKVVYEEIIDPERLVYAHVGEDETSDVQFHVTVTFTAQGAGTEISMRMVFPTAELRDRVADEFGAIEGLHDTMARFAEHLAAHT
jgi:uncharacterized protein YndB with AHSA1/START domain